MNDGAGEGRASSDLRHPRRVLVVALAAAGAVLLAVLLMPSARVAAPGPLSVQHTRAGVRCAACHGERAAATVASAACVACHGDHPSTRAAHAARASQMTCASCHAGHGAPESVDIAAGAVARVPLSPCARCHDLGRASDPARACVGTGAWAGFSVCFDEHQRPGSPLPARGACAREHGPGRFVAWEEARSPGVALAPVRARGSALQTAWIWLGTSGAAGALVFLGGALARRTRRRPAPAALALAPHLRVRLPRIDATTCLGCQACVDACPFDALAVDRHVAVLARPDACCGAAACEQACPNGSLRVVEQDEPVADRPRVDARLESLDRPGLFVAGDLTGVPLIRNAIAQGVAVADRIAETLPGRDGPAAGNRVDLVVVGSGPAGLSAALRARERGLSCVVLEQSDLAASIRAFPRGKIVHDAPIELPVEGPLWFRDSTREELVAHWTRIVRTHRIDVRVQHRVTAIDADAEAGGFRVASQTPAGVQVVRAARVLLATGRRGTPRALDADITPGANARGLVLSALSDARSWAGKRVLVVGLGDSAMEAAVALARQHGTVVTVAYRGKDFSRGSARNIDAVRRLADAGRIRLLLGTKVRRVDVGEATLQGPEGSEQVPVDAVLALVGGEPSRALLAAAGVRLSGRHDAEKPDA